MAALIKKMGPSAGWMSWGSTPARPRRTLSFPRPEDQAFEDRAYMVALKRLAVLFAGLVLVVACAPGPSSPAAPQSGGAEPGAPKTITIGITSSVDAFGNMGGTTTTGGWVSTSEVHSNALVTSDVNTRQPVPR